MDSVSTQGITSSVATVDYLQLLTVQLQNQDPIDPVDQEGLINDLTQFSQLEGLENLNTSFDDMLQLQKLTQGTSLVGKEVSYQNSEGDVNSGVVDEIFNSGDTVNLLIEGNTVALESVVGVSNAASA